MFSGLSTFSAGIAGFWFGNRSSGHPEELETPVSESKGELSNNLINADRASRRPLAEPEIDSKDDGEVFIKSWPKGSAK